MDNDSADKIAIVTSGSQRLSPSIQCKNPLHRVQVSVPTSFSDGQVSRGQGVLHLPMQDADVYHLDRSVACRSRFLDVPSAAKAEAFQMGVYSMDARPTSVIVWTRSLVCSAARDIVHRMLAAYPPRSGAGVRDASAPLVAICASQYLEVLLRQCESHVCMPSGVVS